MKTFSEQSQELSESITMLRGRGAFGRKPAKRAVDHVAQWGPVSLHPYDEASRETTIETRQDVEPILKANREERLSGRDGYTPSRDMKKVASIPLVIVEELRTRGIHVERPGDWPKVAAWLDSSEAAAFRTSSGTISKRPSREYFTTKGR